MTVSVHFESSVCFEFNTKIERLQSIGLKQRDLFSFEHWFKSLAETNQPFFTKKRKFMNLVIPAFEKQTSLYSQGTLENIYYRCIRSFDEAFEKRQPLFSWIDHYMDQQDMSAHCAIRLSAYLESAFDAAFPSPEQSKPKKTPLTLLEAPEENENVAQFEWALTHLKQKGIPLPNEIITLFGELYRWLESAYVVEPRTAFQDFLFLFLDHLRETNQLIKHRHHEKWTISFQNPLPPPDLDPKFDPKPVSKLILNASCYWLLRTFDELKNLRSAFAIGVDSLFDDGLLTMETANELLQISEELKDMDNKHKRFFKFNEALENMKMHNRFPLLDQGHLDFLRHRFSLSHDASWHAN